MALGERQSVAEEEEDEVEQDDADDHVEDLGDHAAPEEVAVHLARLVSGEYLPRYGVGEVAHLRSLPHHVVELLVSREQVLHVRLELRLRVADRVDRHADLVQRVFRVLRLGDPRLRRSAGKCPRTRASGRGSERWRTARQ